MLQSYLGYCGNCYVGRQHKIVTPTTCAVFGCYNRQTTKIKQSFYRFSKDPSRWRQQLAFNGRRNEDGLSWEPGTRDKLCSNHFILRKKSDLPNVPNYIPSVWVVQDLGRDQGKPACYYQVNHPTHPWVNKDTSALAHFEHLSQHTASKQEGEKVTSWWITL